MITELKELKKRIEEVKKYNHAISILSYDFETVCPKKGYEDEASIIDFFSNEAFKLMNSKEMKELIVSLYEKRMEVEDELDRKLIENLHKNYLKKKNITNEFDLEMNKVFSKAGISWLKAKKANDYSLFKKDLEKVVEVTKKAVLLREKRFDNIYDNMLDDCEEGILTEDLDPFFDSLKKGILNILEKIKNSKHEIRTDFINRKVPIHKQQIFSDYLLKLNGFNFDKGYVGQSEHPFTTSIAKSDTRLTTHYYDDMFLSNMFSIIHEGGHGLFMQNEREIDHKHYINNSVTNGMHESVSRFYENVIGRSKEYIHLIYPKFKEIFKEEFSDVSEEELYEAINIVKPSLIRTEADEVTYSIHIIIRYEIEKKLVNGKLTCDEVKDEWNKLYKKYLGVSPKNDSEGILQDIHWTSGFGYFPSYSLGNAYNAMYVKKISEAMDFKNEIVKGNFKKINRWMSDNIFYYANVLTPKEWIYKITNKNLTPDDYISYLEKKYSEIYRFN